MKRKIILSLFLLVSVISFGKQTYTLSKEDFINQFNDSVTLRRVYCYNEAGKKVFLSINENTILVLELKNNTKLKLMLRTIKYKQGIISSVEYNVWWPSKTISKFNLSDITSFTIYRKFGESESHYYNIDSCRAIRQIKNDSLKMVYSSGSEYIIYLISRNSLNNDTISIIENVCYHINFKDNNEIEYGIIRKITEDSIIISNNFMQKKELKDNKEYKIFRYKIKDIQGLRLLKSGGYSYKEVDIRNFNVISAKVKRNPLRCPCWFDFNITIGEIDFYRSWRTENGYKGITKKDGKYFWYER